MSEARSDNGFTLVEVLAALGVFSIAAMAMINLNNETAAGAAHADMRFLAEIEASSQMARTFINPDPLAPGITSGESEQRGRQLTWVRTIAPTERPALVQVEITISDPATGQTLARLQTLKEAADDPA